MRLRWFLSSTVREASDLTKHVSKLLNAQRDILTPQAVDAVEASVRETETAIKSSSDSQAITESAKRLETSANKWLKPYPNAALRENIEVFLVAIVVAMGIRTFFLQPFKIPTGSMQPTLFGMVVKNVADDPDFKMPGFFGRVADGLIRGQFYHEWIAEADGELIAISPPQHVTMFINKRQIVVQYVGHSQPTTHTFWFTPEDAGGGRDPFASTRQRFNKGEPIIRLVDATGDHLFVDRVTYNFRRPKRGEIIVFKTKGIPGLDQTQFYIKRLVGLPDEKVSICDEPPRHACIDGKPLTTSNPHFANVYSFDPKQPPRESQYSGHVREAAQNVMYWAVQNHAPEPHLATPDDPIPVRPGHYLVFGDNTVNSLDSRYWGDLPQENVIGKSWFVYWPIGPRFGWGQQ